VAGPHRATSPATPPGVEAVARERSLRYAAVMSRGHRAEGLAFATRAVHAGHPRAVQGPVETPIVNSVAFAFASAEDAEAAFRGESDAYIYGRWGNPTVEALETAIASLEGGEAAVCTASGMAAVTGSLLALVEAGDHVVASRALYGETARLLRERLPRLGVETTFVDERTPEAFAAAMGSTTRVVYLETPQNPTLRLTDVAAIASLARARGLTTIVDNTFATPWCQTPLALGADVVVHSMTKSLSGHGDAIGGVAVASRAIRDRIADVVVKGLGAVLSPMTAFLIGRGLRTLDVRMERACRSAATIAAWLEGRRGVARVHYPTLPSHPDRELAARQMRAGGALVSFELDGGRAAGRRLLDRVGLVVHAVSLGDARSLITHPASTTASTMPEADRARVGITDGLVRLSVGLEDAGDIVTDLDAALE
jgi:methionine-gamma-lyase